MNPKKNLAKLKSTSFTLHRSARALQQHPPKKRTGSDRRPCCCSRDEPSSCSSCSFLRTSRCFCLEKKKDERHRVFLLTRTMLDPPLDGIQQDLSAVPHAGCGPVTDVCCQVRPGWLFLLRWGSRSNCRLRRYVTCSPCWAVRQVGTEEPFISCCFGDVAGAFFFAVPCRKGPSVCFRSNVVIFAF